VFGRTEASPLTTYRGDSDKSFIKGFPMQVSEVGEHKGWKIYTFCHEDKQEGWMPGDPLRYHAWGSAEECRMPSADRTWKPTEILKISPAYFDDADFAHVAIKRELIRRIAGVK
jgi:hypothetical protein